MRFARLLSAGIKYVTNDNYRFLIDAGRGKYNSLSDEEFLKKKFQAIFGYPLDLTNPRTFSEKIQWLKLYDRKREYTTYVDKYLVRDYIKHTIGEEYLIPLLGVWDDPKEIDFNILPDQFVLKCNHNSGQGMCICKRKSELNIDKVIADIYSGLAQDYYIVNREWPYKNVPRKVICEKYMVDESGDGLRDYKVLCFNGKARLVEFHQGRFTDHQTQDFYTSDWRLTNISQSGFAEASEDREPAPAPSTLQEMIQLSEILAKDLIHVRIDWYSVNGRLYFGEITFYDGSGFDKFDKMDYDLELGRMIELPTRKREEEI